MTVQCALMNLVTFQSYVLWTFPKGIRATGFALLNARKGHARLYHMFLLKDSSFYFKYVAIQPALTCPIFREKLVSIKDRMRQKQIKLKIDKTQHRNEMVFLYSPNCFLISNFRKAEFEL